MNPARVEHERSKSIQKLRRWMAEVGAVPFSFVNCSHESGWMRPTAEDVALLEGCVRGGQVVVCVGRQPSRVLGQLGVDHFQLPHPSGLNRQLNDPEFERS